ncbi:hypothetical protein RJY08_002272 [Vibrio alginolyticus]|nr:hypothetical protein [Vibrio alginolyticus]
MMSIVQKSPVDYFWYDQNKKLLANPLFRSEMGDYFDDVWYFSNGDKTTVIDFSVFDLPIFNLESAATLKKNEIEYTLSSKQYAKLICSVILSPRSSQWVQPVYQMVMHVFAFLNERNEIVLSPILLDSFWTSFLARTVNKNGLFNRVSVPSYNSFIKPVSLPTLRNRLFTLGITGVIEQKLTQKKIEKSLDEVCQLQYSITLKEFKKGGSFNFLGLNLGQYYVDYLNHVYQTNFLYAAVCTRAVDVVVKKIDMVNIIDPSNKARLFNVILAGLLGEELDKTQLITKGIEHQYLKKLMEKVLLDEYNQHFEAVCSLRDENIEWLVIDLGLSDRFDAVEVIRVLMLQKYLGLQGHKSAEDVWLGYLSSLDKSFTNSKLLDILCVDDIYEKMSLRINQLKLNGKECLTQIQKWALKLIAPSTFKNYKSFKKLLRMQTHAMTALVVAWTGYRQSEYGFPLSAIRTEPNLDILDNSYVPFRFKLKWFVPKTNGGTKIDREITSKCYQLAAQLNGLFGHECDEPCLYALTDSSNIQTVHESTSYIESRLSINWAGFVNDYQPFNEVVRLNELLQKSCELTNLEKKEADALSLKYSVGSARYRNLLSSAKEVKSDWLRLSHTSFSGARAQKNFSQSLIAYSQGDPVKNVEHQTIIDRYLSSETKALLQSGTISLEDNKTKRDINTEILEGVRYPSPHAFRHVWAEAVLTRYQGDVGAVIRHQFCHMDNSFFMAYLRDKDAKGLMQLAKQRYLNSIVELLILETESFDELHSGGFSRFVQKATQLTQVKTNNQLLALQEKIEGRIIDIQPSRFAVCIPRDGGVSRAKCAKMGNLNPQDAKPEFCLDCINAWVAEGHIRGIWQTIQPMVKEALHPEGIGFLLESHLPALTSSWRRIKELRNSRNSERVDRILPAIEEAIASIKHKMAIETKKYGYE